MFSKIHSLVKSKDNNQVANTKNQKANFDKNKDFEFALQVKEPDLNFYKLTKLKTIYYIPNIVKDDIAESILRKLYDQSNAWVSLQYSNRRVLKIGGDVTSEGLIPEPLPDWADFVITELEKYNIFKDKPRPNHLLINEYPAGIGIMPHTDGPSYYPYVVILSLLSSCVFNFFENYETYKNETRLASLFVEKNSLLIFTNECYEKFLHCIDDLKYDWIYAETKDGNIIKSNIDNLNTENLEKNDIFDKNIAREKRISITIRFVHLKK